MSLLHRRPRSWLTVDYTRRPVVMNVDGHDLPVVAEASGPGAAGTYFLSVHQTPDGSFLVHALHEDFETGCTDADCWEHADASCVVAAAIKRVGWSPGSGLDIPAQVREDCIADCRARSGVPQ